MGCSRISGITNIGVGDEKNLLLPPPYPRFKFLITRRRVYWPIKVDNGAIASGGLPSGPAGGVSMTPDAIPILDTSNPSTMVWTVNAIKNLNISGSLESIYG